MNPRSIVCFFIMVVTAVAGRSSVYSQQHDDVLTLFTFDTSDEASWRVINDGVMGGRSKGYVSVGEGTLKFTGTLVTRGGGFTSIRAARDISLDGYAGLELRVRGNGRQFEVQVDDGTRMSGRVVSRRAPFATLEDWQVVRIPFSSLKTTVFGRTVSAPPLDLTNVQGIGLFILDGKDGDFMLEVDAVRAYGKSARSDR